MTIPFPEEPFVWAQAKSLGVHRQQLRDAIRDRTLVRPHLGVYVRADVELTISQRLRAAALVMPPGSVVVDRSAAGVWGVDCFRYRELDHPPPLEWATLRGRRSSKRAEVHGRSRDLVPEDWSVVEGVRVLTPLRTAMDLGCSLNRRDALSAMDALMRAHGFTRSQMRAMLRRYARRRGVVQLRELISLVDPRAESSGETWTRLAIVDANLPVPELQWWVDVEGVPTYRLDLAYPKAKIAIEYDGAEHHSSRADKLHDEQRRRWLRCNGWTVIVVDRNSFDPDALDAWIAELRAALATARQRPTRIYTSAS